MKILVTGATGLVGKKLIWGLLAEGGHEVSILTRNKKKAAMDFDFPLGVYEWANPAVDLPPAESLVGVDAVIHLAGESIADGRWSKAKKDRLWSSRVDASRNLIKAIEQISGAKPSCIISSSAIGFYGDRKNEKLDEESTRGDGYLAELCDGWEKAAQSEVLKETRFIQLRTGIVLSDDGGALSKMLPPFMMGAGGRLASGKQWMSWIHIDDLVGMILFSLKNKNISGIVNGTAPNPVNNSSFTKVLAKVIRRPAIFPVPALAMKIIFGEMSCILLEGQRVHPTKILANDFEFQYSHLFDALSNLLSHKKMADSNLIKVQYVEQPVDKVFSFYSDAKNLEQLTPAYLKFKVLGKSTEQMEKGTLINYRLSLRGLPMSWTSEITQWKPQQYFADEQLKGPYSKWSHLHSFYSYKGGTIIRDEITYAVPFGLLGKILVGWYVTMDVQSIFRFRYKKTLEIFG